MESSNNVGTASIKLGVDLSDLENGLLKAQDIIDAFIEKNKDVLKLMKNDA